MKNKFSLSSVSLVLGSVAIISGLVKPSSSLMAGVMMTLGALAYRSRKKVKLGITDEKNRKTWEVLAIGLIVLLFIGPFFTVQNWGIEIYNDPVPNLIIPIWALVAYYWVRMSTVGSPLQTEQSPQ